MNLIILFFLGGVVGVALMALFNTFEFHKKDVLEVRVQNPKAWRFIVVIGVIVAIVGVSLCMQEFNEKYLHFKLSNEYLQIAFIGLCIFIIGRIGAYLSE